MVDSQTPESKEGFQFPTLWSCTQCRCSRVDQDVHDGEAAAKLFSDEAIDFGDNPRRHASHPSMPWEEDMGRSKSKDGGAAHGRSKSKDSGSLDQIRRRNKKALTWSFGGGSAKRSSQSEGGSPKRSDKTMIFDRVVAAEDDDLDDEGPLVRSASKRSTTATVRSGVSRNRSDSQFVSWEDPARYMSGKLSESLGLESFVPKSEMEPEEDVNASECMDARDPELAPEADEQDEDSKLAPANKANSNRLLIPAGATSSPTGGVKRVVSKPSVVEIERGVHVEHVYDFFTFEEQRVHVKSMSSEVFHYRYAEKVSSDSSSSGSEGTDSSALDTARSHDDAHKSTPRRRHKSMFEKGTRKDDVVKMKSGNYEVLTNWGVFASKMIRMRVLDFTSVVNKATHQKQKRTYMASSARRGAIFGSMRTRALVVVRQAREIASLIAKEPHDQFDSKWGESELVQLFSTEFVDTLTLLAITACKILTAQPSLVEVPAPCRVFGDLHGQFRDLLLLFQAFGAPDEPEAPNFVFNGDFVDRGSHQLEVIGLLLAYKIVFPEKVYLIRGNHEDRHMNKKYGFADECNKRLGKEGSQLVFDAVHKAFDVLPLAALISDRVLVLHGGIGDGAWTLADVRNIKRPLKGEDLAEKWIFQILWSDPIEDDELGAIPKGQSKVDDVFGVHLSPRGSAAQRFGWNITKMFCARNALALIVRSHQSKRDSPGFDIMHENQLIRVFSARDYEGHGNDGAVLLIHPDDEFTVCSPKKGRPTTGLLNVRPQVLSSTAKTRQLNRSASLKSDNSGVRSSSGKGLNRSGSRRKSGNEFN